MSDNKMFYCPKCKRVYFLAPNAFYLCNQERNFGLPSNEPWPIPEFVHYDAGGRELACLLSTCGSPTEHHPSGGHSFELLTRDEVVRKFKEAVLIEAAI